MHRLTGTMLVALLALLALAATGCGDDAKDAGADATDQPGGSDGLSGSLLVFAASSLTDAFGAIEVDFETAHPDVDMQLNLAGSSTLREQILEGAPADVFAAANASNMDAVVEGDAVTATPQVFVRNRLEIAVPDGNPGDVTGLADFADDELLIGLCAEDVPCGEFGRDVLANAGVAPSIDTNEPDVRSLLTKIEADELDAGIVYVTDILSAGEGVEGIDIPDDVNVVASYPIAPLAESPNPDTAAAFVAYVLSAEGQATLATYGFAAP